MPLSRDQPSALTAIRKFAAPHLPPPLLRGIHTTDTYFHLNYASNIRDHDHSGIWEEPSMAILTAILLASCVGRLLRGIWASTTKRSTAHLTGAEDAVLGGLTGNAGGGRGDQIGAGASAPSFRETVVICGASNAGKTALWHCLCRAGKGGGEEEQERPMTVTSLVANVGYARGVHGTIRIIDYPGHPSLSSQLTTLLLPSATSRLVFALDATQPVTVGAAMLYHILTHAQIRISWEKEGKTLPMLVVCTKKDAKGAKNYKRMKIQLRNEVERLRKLDLAVAESAAIANKDTVKAVLSAKGKAVDLDDLGSDIPMSLHFVEAGSGMVAAVHDFVLKAVVPENRLTQRNGQHF